MNEKLKERNLKNTLRKGAINNGNEVLRQGPSMRGHPVCGMPATLANSSLQPCGFSPDHIRIFMYSFKKWF
jgi:hypothetical protein